MDPRLRNFGFLLKDVSRRYVMRFEQRASAISLTLPQCKVLARLENHEGVSQARLADLAEVDPMTMVRILDRMEADGMLERRLDPADRRARCLFLTPKAKSLLEQIWRLSEQTRAEIFAGIGRAERDMFMTLLEQMHGNICAFTDRPVGTEDSTAPLPQAKPTQARSRRSRTGKSA
jgi:MarR family transcriptional regulator for hemolysin